MSGYLLKFKQTYSVKIGGRRYPVVKIGNQLWMAENLDYKFDVNGSQIPIGGSVIPEIPHAWYYNNNETDYGINGTYKCGLLYNWYAAKYLDDNKALLLPEGWHIPSLSEYNNLIELSGGIDVVGSKLKALDNSVVPGFPPDNWGESDPYKFSLLPAGTFYGLNGFTQIGEYCRLWMLTSYDSTNAYLIRFSKNDLLDGTGAKIDYDNKVISMSIRLVKSLT